MKFHNEKRVFLILSLFALSLGLKAQTGLVGIKDCANGFHHNLLISYTDSLYAFGENVDGQIGDGTNTNVAITKALNVKALGVGTGYNFSFYIKTDSTLMAAGNNSSGELGIGSSTTSMNVWTAISTGVSGLHFRQVAGSANHALAVTGNGVVYAWGLNKAGEVGDNSTNKRTSPVQVQVSSTVNLTNIKKVAAGSPSNNGNTGGHSLALSNDGTVWAWGLNNSGQLGNNSTSNSLRAIQVRAIGGAANSVLSNVIDIAASGSSSFALLSDSTVVSWGENGGGQLGNGTTTARSFPGLVKINSTTNISSIKQITASGAALGDDVLAMLKSNGQIWNVGTNNRGQLGDGTVTNRSYAVQNTPALNRSFLKIVGTGHYLLQLAADTLGNYCESGHQINGSFGNGTLADVYMSNSTCLTIPLVGIPVTLSAFTGKRVGDNTVVLRWTTETEISNDKFDIEYTADGGEGHEFEVIGTVKGNGTSFKSNNYQFIHTQTDNKVTGYYRLRQNDFNGAFEYHKTIAVKPGVEVGNIYSNPNPTKGIVSVTLTEETNTDYVVSVMDQTGRVIFEKTGHIYNNPVSEKIDLNGYDRGFYFITIKTDFGTKIEKIAKQ